VHRRLIAVALVVAASEALFADLAWAGIGGAQVSTLRKRLEPGTYTLTFKLNSTGRRILDWLGARDRAYRERHPHGQRPPTIAFGVGLGYTPTG
jgi:hypothetical protein